MATSSESKASSAKPAGPPPGLQQQERKAAPSASSNVQSSQRQDRPCRNSRTTGCKRMTKSAYCDECYTEQQKSRGLRKCGTKGCKGWTQFKLCKMCFEAKKHDALEDCATPDCPIKATFGYKLCPSCYNAEKEEAMKNCATPQCSGKIYVPRHKDDGGDHYCQDCWRKYKQDRDVERANAHATADAQRPLRDCESCGKVKTRRRLCDACDAADWKYTIRNCRECGLKHAGACGSSQWIRT